MEREWQQRGRMMAAGRKKLKKESERERHGTWLMRHGNLNAQNRELQQQRTEARRRKIAKAGKKRMASCR